MLQPPAKPAEKPTAKPKVFHRLKGIIYRRVTIPLTGPDAQLVKEIAARNGKSEQLVLQELLGPGLAMARSQVG